MPAPSVIVTVKDLEPSPDNAADGAMVTLPAEIFVAVSVAVPTAVPPTRSVTVSPSTGAAAPVPFRATVTVGVVSLVAPLDATGPVTVPASSVTLLMVGAAGAVLSTTSDVLPLSGELGSLSAGHSGSLVMEVSVSTWSSASSVSQLPVVV